MMAYVKSHKKAQILCEINPLSKTICEKRSFFEYSVVFKTQR